MIPEELRSTWSSPVGPFMVESNSAPGPLEDEKLGSWAMFVTRPLPRPVGSGCTAGFGEAGMVSPGFWVCNFLVRIVYQHLLCFNSLSSHREWCLVGALSSEGPGDSMRTPMRPFCLPAPPCRCWGPSLREEPSSSPSSRLRCPRLWFVGGSRCRQVCGLCVPLRLLPGGLGSPAYLLTSPKAS